MIKFYIYVENYKYSTLFDLSSQREDLIKEIFGTAYENEISYAEIGHYPVFKDEVIAKLEQLLKYHPMPESSMPVYRDRFEEKDVYIIMNVLGKKLKLFRGGSDALIAFLVIVLTIIEYAINNEYKIKVSKYSTEIEFLMAKKKYLGLV